MRLATKEVLAVTLAQLTHLYVMDLGILGVLSAPLLSSLTLDPAQYAFSPTDLEYLPRFFHRSRCHLESLSVAKEIFMTTMLSSVFTSEACSTVSRLKFELLRRTDGVEGLTLPSVLPNLRHIILCISQDTCDDLDTVLAMVRSRRDAGMLKLFEIQFEEKRFEYFYEVDIQALTRDDFKARFAQWDPPRNGHRYLSGML